MSQGKRESEGQREFWTPTDQLAQGPGHVFYDKLDRLLADHGFELFVEQLCQPHYKTGGRPSIPPGVYFRMLMIGYLEGIDSQRGIAWRCEDSLALRRFLGISLSAIRERGRSSLLARATPTKAAADSDRQFEACCRWKQQPLATDHPARLLI